MLVLVVLVSNQPARQTSSSLWSKQGTVDRLTEATTKWVWVFNNNRIALSFHDLATREEVDGGRKLSCLHLLREAYAGNELRTNQIYRIECAFNMFSAKKPAVYTPQPVNMLFQGDTDPPIPT